MHECSIILLERCSDIAALSIFTSEEALFGEV